MTNLQKFRHDLLWYLATQKIKQTVTEAKLAHLQQAPELTGSIYTKQIKR